MILLVDLSDVKGSMHALEFVDPVKYVLDAIHVETEVIHFTGLSEKLDGNGRNLPKSIILCGTALKDNHYQNEISAFECLKTFTGPVLGICAGMHVIGMLWGGELVNFERIGLHPFKLNTNNPVIHPENEQNAYHLHNYTVTISHGFHFLAEDHGFPVAFKHDNMNHYGVLFHPEVRNRNIIERFSLLHSVDLES